MQAITPGRVQTGISLTSDDIDATHAHFTSLGVDVDAEIARMGAPVPPMFCFRDPDPNTLMGESADCGGITRSAVNNGFAIASAGPFTGAIAVNLSRRRAGRERGL
jgi:hypothetical protein